MDRANVSVVYSFAAIILAVMVARLYFFYHTFSSQVAPQKEFNLRKPSAYRYDILVLGFMVVIPLKCLLCSITLTRSIVGINGSFCLWISGHILAKSRTSSVNSNASYILNILMCQLSPGYTLVRSP